MTRELAMMLSIRSSLVAFLFTFTGIIALVAYFCIHRVIGLGIWWAMAWPILFFVRETVLVVIPAWRKAGKS